VGDQVHVDGAGVRHRAGPDAGVEHPGQPGAPRGAQHQLGGVRAAGELEQRGGHVVADDGVQGGVDTLGELAQPDGRSGRTSQGAGGETVAAQHVHAQQIRRPGPVGDAGGAA